ncbi:protein rep [Levilactobacillus brevis]
MIIQLLHVDKTGNMTAHIINILHVLLFVRSSYFKSSDSYINQEEWTRLWQKALKSRL